MTSGVTTKLKRALAGRRNANREVQNGIAEVRQEIFQRRDQRAQIAAMPVPLEAALEAVDAGLDRLCDAALDALPLGPLTRPARHAEFSISDHPEALLGLLAALCREDLRGMMVTRLTAFYKNTETMEADVRQSAVAKIDAEVFQLEVLEESLIREAGAAGVAIMRRPDADPRAVLAVLDDA